MTIFGIGNKILATIEAPTVLKNHSLLTTTFRDSCNYHSQVRSVSKPSWAAAQKKIRHGFYSKRSVTFYLRDRSLGLHRRYKPHRAACPS